MILFRINDFHSKVAILRTVAEPFQNLSNHFKIVVDRMKLREGLAGLLPIGVRQELFIRAKGSEQWSGLLYQSDESGRYEIYIQAFPEPRGKRRISMGGGRDC